MNIPTCEFCKAEITNRAHKHVCDEMNKALRKRREPRFQPPAPERTPLQFAKRTDIPEVDAAGRALDPKTGKLLVQPSRKELGHKISNPLLDQYNPSLIEEIPASPEKE